MALVPEFISVLRKIRDNIYPDMLKIQEETKPVLDDLDNINIVADVIKKGTDDGGTGGGQFLGNSLVGSVMFSGQSTNENLILPEGTNGLIVGGLTIEDGGSLTQENGTTLVGV